MSSNPPDEINSLIEAHISAFNDQDDARFISVFNDTAIIVDGIAPYLWLGPNAPANWLADCVLWRKKFGVTREHIAYTMGFWNVEGDSAYAVISGSLTVVIGDQPVIRTGTLAYTFAKRDGAWKIGSQSWGRTS